MLSLHGVLLPPLESKKETWSWHSWPSSTGWRGHT